MALQRLTLTTPFLTHLDAVRQRGLRLQTLAALTGFSDVSNFLSQLRVPFAATNNNRERWQTVALLTNFVGEPFDTEAAS